MEILKIEGGKQLSGEIKIGGAKNSAVALIPASILSNEKVTIANVPEISDVNALSEILEFLGAKIERKEDMFIVDSSKIKNKPLTENISKKLRASYYFMGVLLAKFKKVEMHFPGGCSIGKRPIDFHLKGFKALGATISEKENRIIVKAEKLKGAHIYLDFASVGATINIMFAATMAEGKTIIENPAKEPEIVNIATFLNNMGAKITGAGTKEIKIEGVKELKGCFSEVIPDRIEAGTYIVLGALLGKKLKITNIIPKHLEPLISKLQEMGVDLELGNNYCYFNNPQKLKGTKIKTLPHPGFPTDLQQPLTALLALSIGKSTVEENLYENRFQHIKYLNKMGAKIKQIDEENIEIIGVEKLYGQKVKATDLRAGACLIIAGLVAKGETVIENMEHVLRGYEKIEEKLTKIGAKIELIEI